ncbi:protein LATERAL ORGAN BOUNDARIES [Lactuca sativa]|uniref:protein LATERAL ORGAN BOUNDARIES n=1 Tax=Lactuca sativa TaxID=4236 RepID=UPI000CBC2B5B|nr:protein LATERAL ORGAN BOUNDARIES [Lactuca sativa]XP_042758330.1 protein LATERAL ORGAN BOUNDARIES [Lactuca sativa]
MASASSYNSPCAACKFLRRKCMPGCIFAPYFPPEEPQKFANVHKIFGASNVTKLLNDLLPHQREDAVNSLAYEAEARVRDPVYGCVGAISFLQRQVDRLQKELDAANADLIRYACNEIPTGTLPAAVPHLNSIQPITPRQRTMDHYPTRRTSGNIDGGGNGGGGFYQSPPSFPNPYANQLQWNPSTFGGNMGGGGGGQG